MKIETPQSATVIAVMIVYDSIPAGKCAKEFCDRLQQQLGSECELNLSLWNLMTLQDPALAQVAAEMDARSGLLLVAISGDKPLPAFVRSWVSRCARQARVVDGAIVALFHGILQMEQEVAPAYGDLERIAHESGVNFFSEVIEVQDRDLDDRINEIHVRAHIITPVLAEILQTA